MADMTRLLLLLLAVVSVSSAASLEKRIIGGDDCKDNERLYHVQLVDVNGDFFCGGSIIHEDWVLTAAHCWKLGMQVKLGMHPDPNKGTTVGIVESKVHPDYEKKDVDIMLLKLKESTKIIPVPLPKCGTDDKPKPSYSVQMAGHTYSPAKPGELKVVSYSPDLLCVKMKIEDCPTGVQNRLCYLSDEKDVCRGDSGGGVVYEGKIYGVHVASGKYACNLKARSMDVCAYKKWIDDTMAGP